MARCPNCRTPLFAKLLLIAPSFRCPKCEIALVRPRVGPAKALVYTLLLVAIALIGARLAIVFEGGILFSWLFMGSLLLAYGVAWLLAEVEIDKRH